MKSSGDIIEEFLFKKGITKSKLSSMLGETRQNTNNKLSKKDLSASYIYAISKALEHDFFADLSQEFQNQTGIVSIHNRPAESVEDAIWHFIKKKLSESK